MPIIVLRIFKMPSKSFKHIQRNYDLLSSFYDLLSGQAESEIFHRVIDLLRSRKFESLLDIGCGTGKGLAEFEKEYSGKTSLMGIDLSLKMCQKAIKKNKRIANANALNLPIKASTFDAIIFSFSLEIIPEKFINLALDECVRVLKPRGIVCITCMAEVPDKNFISVLYLWAHKKFPKVIDCQPISALHFLDKNRFMIFKEEISHLYGLPVEIIMAEKK